MKLAALRTTLIAGICIFAVAWTLLMGFGVTGTSPGAQPGAPPDAAQFGAGAHIMYVDETNFPAITVYLAVNDANGQPVLNLPQEKFTLREDSQAVDITSFVGAGGGSSSTVLVIDQSGSMGDENKLAGAVKAAKTYIDFLRAGSDQLSVIVFSDFPITLAPLNVVNDQGRMILKGLLDALFPLSGTEFYVATQDAIRSLSNVSGRKVVLALTDGMDNNGQAGLGQTVAAAIQANIPVYTVGLGNEVDRDGLERLASQSGGQSYFKPDAAQLQTLYESIASGLRNEYALTYQSATPNLDGTQRNLKVAIAAAAGDMSAGGSYAVGGVLASTLNWAIFLPILLVLLVALCGLLLLPRVVKRRDRRRTPPPSTELPTAAPAAPEQRQPVAEPVRAANLAPSIADAVAISAPPQRDSPSIVAAPAPATAATHGTLVLEFPLVNAETVAGSAITCTLVLPDSSIAAQQARFSVANGRTIIDDLSGPGGTQVSFAGDPSQLRPVQRNALRDGSLIQFGVLRFVFRQVGDAPPWLERRLAIPADGVTIGTDTGSLIQLAGSEAQACRVRTEGQHWIVERSAGACQVSFGGDPAQFRPVSERNALKVGSRIRIGLVPHAVEMRLEE